MKDTSYYRHSRNDMIEFLPSKYNTVLEIGCGQGAFRKHLINNCEVWGVDPACLPNNPKDFHVFINSFYAECASEIPDNYFDVIVCNDVIEHVSDHDELLYSIHKKLKKGGSLVGSVPNVRYIRNLYNLLIRKDWRYADSGILDATHVRFFTEKSIRHTLTKHNFSIDKFRGIHSMLLPLKETPRHIFKNVAIYGIIIISFRYYCDVQYLQFGFRARKQ